MRIFTGCSLNWRASRYSLSVRASAMAIWIVAALGESLVGEHLVGQLGFAVVGGGVLAAGERRGTRAVRWTACAWRAEATAAAAIGSSETAASTLRGQRCRSLRRRSGMRKPWVRCGAWTSLGEGVKEKAPRPKHGAPCGARVAAYGDLGTSRHAHQVDEGVGHAGDAGQVVGAEGPRAHQRGAGLEHDVADRAQVVGDTGISGATMKLPETSSACTAPWHRLHVAGGVQADHHDRALVGRDRGERRPVAASTVGVAPLVIAALEYALPLMA
jgi:hypothetical protein